MRVQSLAITTFWKLRLASALAAASFSAAPAQDCHWTYEWHAEKLPQDASRIWMFHPRGETFIRDGALVLSSPLQGATVWSVSPESSDGLWIPNQALTVEFKARAIEVAKGADAAAETGISNGKFRCIVGITDRNFHVYRVSFDNADARLLIDDVPAKAGMKVIQLAANDAIPRRIYFGDCSNRVGGTSEWVFFRWSLEGVPSSTSSWRQNYE